jgi:23S rRNA (guanosine2251-2'-O)-methyltransferase
MSRASRKPRRPPARRAGESSSIWLTGFHPVREALRARRRRLDRLWIRAGKAGAEQTELMELARSAGVIVEIVERAAFGERAEFEGNDQGVALRVGPLPELSLDELLDFATSTDGAGSRLVLLDGVEDPQNVGALARVAESAGAHGLILTERRAPALTPAVSRASAGAIEWLRVARVSNLGRALTELQKRTYWVVAAAPASSAGLFEIDDRILTGNLAIVLGAEGRGIRRSILEQADHLVEIPMRGQIASLNVATAGAIILYDLLRRSESAAARSEPAIGGVG